MNNQTRDVLFAVVFFAFIISGMAIAAWLVVMCHPWFALLILCLLAGVRMKTKDDNKEAP